MSATMSDDYRRSLLARLRSAYERCGIPWDEALANLTEKSLRANTTYWEAKAGNADTPITRLKTVGQMRDRLRQMSGLSRGTNGGRHAKICPRPKKCSVLLAGFCGDGGLLS